MSGNPSYTTLLEFLCSLDLDGIEEDLELEGPEHQNCPDCHEPYSTKSWEFGKRVEYPARRFCGHYHGLKCLTRMAVSEELGYKECPQCKVLCPSDDVMRYMKRREPHSFHELARIDIAVHNAISTARLLRDLEQPVDWSQIFVQVYEASYIFYEGDVSVIADSAFSFPLLLLEVSLRTMGFFNGDSNLPNVPQLQQDLNDLRKRLDSRPSLPKEWYMPEIEVMMSRADLRRTAFVTAVNEMNAEKGQIGWTKHQQDSLRRDIQWFFWQKVNWFTILLLVFLAGLQLVFLAAIWGVLTEKE